MKETCFFKTKQGVRICYGDYGDPHGVPVMYFHGWPSSRLQGRQIHEVAVEKGIRLIAPDRPGIGQSDFVEGRVLKDWPQVVNDLADHVGWERFGVMGVSGGGPYALAAARWLPERVTRADVICGAVPLAKFPDRREMMWPYRTLLAIRPRVPWLIPSVLKLSRKISECPPEQPPMSLILKCTAEADREMILSKGCFADLTRSFREGLAQGARGVQWDGDVYTSDWELDFENIEIPVGLWHGSEDKNIPFAMVKTYADWIPKVERHFFEGEGHYSVAMGYAAEVLEGLRGSVEQEEALPQ